MSNVLAGTLGIWVLWLLATTNQRCFLPLNLLLILVVIEEITEDDKPKKENGKSKRIKKKKNNQPSDQEDQNNSQRQIVLKRDAGISVLESEDEDGFPISSSAKRKVTVQEPQAEINGQKDKETTQETKKKIDREDNDDTTGKKRKVKSIDEDGQPERWDHP